MPITPDPGGDCCAEVLARLDVLLARATMLGCDPAPLLAKIGELEAAVTAAERRCSAMETSGLVAVTPERVHDTRTNGVGPSVGRLQPGEERGLLLFDPAGGETPWQRCSTSRSQATPLPAG